MPSREMRWWVAHSKRLVLSLAVVTLLVGLSPVRGQEEPKEPPYFAVINARIVPVSGPVIDKGTILIADGVIQSVGEVSKIPPESRVIDGDGWTIYPGLIDAMTTLGLPAPQGQPSPAGPGGFQAVLARAARQKPAQGPEDRPSTTPWKNAADELALKDKRIENWRKGGFTSAVTVPEKGIFPGQAAFIDLSGGRARDLVVKTPVALRINLSPSGGFFGFPSSRMGTLSYVRQVFYDADQYDKAWSIYERHPRGLQRPSYDRSLEPIRDTIATRRPVLIPAGLDREIRRALRLADEFHLNAILFGAQGGYAVADELASRKVPVLVNLKWPEKPKDPDPELQEALRVLQHRKKAPSTPAALSRAGVKFAFYSGGLASPKEILKHTRKALDAGLTADAALRALTLSAAEIFGVSDRLGSLEEGKIANLVLTDGDLFGEKTKVKMVFVDGKIFEIREPARPKEKPATDISGKWILTVNAPQGAQESTADLEMEEDGTLGGSITGRRGTNSIASGWVSGNKFSFTLNITMGPRSVEVTYTGTIEGEELKGSVSFGPMSADFSGKRPNQR